jgi:hypothetical protein
MAASGKYIHNSAHTGLTIALTNAYVAGAQRHNLPLNQDMSTSLGNKAGVARLSALWVRVDTIAAGATSLTVRLTRDAAGDQPWIGDTTATLSTGITTATAGCVLIKIDVDYKHLADSSIWLHAKTNAGTCNIKAIELTWEE